MLTCSDQTHPLSFKDRKKKTFCTRHVSPTLQGGWGVFLPDIKQREGLQRGGDECHPTVRVRGKKNNNKKHKSRTRTESCEKETNGIMWVLLNSSRAERGMRGNNGGTQRASWEEVHQSALAPLCTAARVEEAAGPLKTGRGRKGKKGRKSGPAERQ